MRGLVGQPLPAQAHMDGWDEPPVTDGLTQVPGEDHFAIFDDAAAAALYEQFSLTALGQDAPELE